MILPLAGRRVLITRPREQAGELAAALEAAGATVIAIPLIAILPPRDAAPLQAALAAPERYGWVAFTSVHAVRATFAHAPGLTGPRLAAVGGRTAAEVRRHAGRCELVAEPATAAELARAMRAEGVAGVRVLFPRGDRARETLIVELAAAGALVDAPEAYRTVSGLDDDGQARLREALTTGLDWVVLTSPSTWHELVAAVGVAALAPVRLAAMGPTTAQALAEHGRTPAAAPASPGLEALVAALVAAELAA